MFVHDRAEAGPDGDFLRGFADGFKRPDPRVEVRHGDDPVEIVVVVGIGVGREAEFLRANVW